MSLLSICEAAVFRYIIAPDTLSKEPRNQDKVVPVLELGTKAWNRTGD